MLVLLGASPAGARKYALTITFDNDALTWANRDRYYSNGIEFAFSWPAPARWFCRGADHRYDSRTGTCYSTHASRHRRRALRLRVALGQRIYTPDDQHNLAIVRDDRPFAGWTYVDLSLRYLSDVLAIEGALVVGLTGRGSGASQLQRWFHNAILKQRSTDGWAHQIGTELTIALRSRASYKLLSAATMLSATHHWFDASLEAETWLGLPFTWFALGGHVRLGYLTRRLDSPHGPRPFLRHFQFYLFARIVARVVLRNDTIQGAALAPNPHTAPLRNWAPWAQFGIALQSLPFDFAVSVVVRAAESFPEQNRPNHLFGRVAITGRW